MKGITVANNFSPLTCVVLMCLAAPVVAQQAAPFPAESKAVSGEALQALVSGKTFRAQPATGAAWKILYRSNGYVYLDVANGYRDTGKWKVDGAMLCAEWQKSSNAAPCNETREMPGGALVLRRGNGDLLALMPD